MGGRRGTTSNGAAAAALAAVTLLALLQLAAPQATGRAAARLNLTRAERAYLRDPAVAGLRNPRLEPLAARAVARFDSLPAARTEAVARRVGLTTDRLRNALATDAASLRLDAEKEALHYECSFDIAGINTTALMSLDLQPPDGGRRRALKGLDGITPPDQLDPDVSQAFLLHR
jgi:hypothetical protein